MNTGTYEGYQIPSVTFLNERKIALERAFLNFALEEEDEGRRLRK